MVTPRILCKRCEATLDYVSLMTVAKPQDFVLAQCPYCYRIDTVPAEIWFKDAIVRESQSKREKV